MKDFIEKISSYNIFNYLLPGVLFAIFAEKMTAYRIIQDDLIVTLFLCYFIGLCISRIGSLILEPILKKISFIRFAPYADFVEAAKTDPKLEILSESNNMYRTLCSLFFCLCLLMGYEASAKVIGISQELSAIGLCVLLGLLFAWSYRKQSTYITKRTKIRNK